MLNDETKCGNCLYWYPWKDFAVKGVLSKRRVVQKGEETGCDGKCCCYEHGMVVGPMASWDTLAASCCKHYTPRNR